MSAPATLPPQDRPVSSFGARLAKILVFSVMGVLLVVRATSELALMRESGSDPQMAIWMMFLAATLAYWLLAGCVVAGVLFFRKPNWRIAAGLVLLLGWACTIRMEIWKVHVQKQALADARDSSTSPEKLGQLLQFGNPRTGFESELDNRIAAHPHATPEILRALYGRHQLGTLMILARSPKTPEDILQAMVDHDLTRTNQDFENKWIRESLEKNPKLPDAIRRKLEGDKLPATK